MTVAIILSVGSFQTAARIASRSKFLAPPGVPNQGVEAAVLSRNRLDLRVKTRAPTPVRRAQIDCPSLSKPLFWPHHLLTKRHERRIT